MATGPIAAAAAPAKRPAMTSRARATPAASPTATEWYASAGRACAQEVYVRALIAYVQDIASRLDAAVDFRGHDKADESIPERDQVSGRRDQEVGQLVQRNRVTAVHRQAGSARAFSTRSAWLPVAFSHSPTRPDPSR